MDEVTNPASNYVRLEMDISNHQIVAYQDNYKVLGWIVLGASFMPFLALFTAPWPILLFVILFWLALVAAGMTLVLKERRQRWDHSTQMVVFEARWPGSKFKPSKKIPIHKFEDVQIMTTPRTNQRGIEETGPGVLVRVRYEKDSRHTYPGKNSWRIGSFHSTEYAEDAEYLAQKVAQVCGVPVRNSLASRG
ncbi:hypothetical protein [Marinobacter confluentis]|uniref:Uncharacterized protein n=1 Tax=Marinobacter confluentis TaxID=1697557 RepID=A0A4Z1BSG0_9GAMM|nr:hypothetical protein [Marinobacter confluentis]TGN40159.1 hypothetical protein E5Q11_07680 [Marinobacter confluentis]